MVINDDIDGLKSFLRNRSTEMKIQEYSCIYFPSICLKSKKFTGLRASHEMIQLFFSLKSVSQSGRQTNCWNETKVEKERR